MISLPILNSESLSLFSATVSAWLLNGLGVEFIREGVYLYTPSGSVQFEVADICSGMKSLVIMSFFSVIYGFFVYKSALRTFFLLTVFIPLALLANVLRIVILCLFAYHFGQDFIAFHINTDAFSRFNLLGNCKCNGP